MAFGYIVGQLRDDADRIGRGGWLLGSFFPEVGIDSDRHVGMIEVKYWEFAPGDESGHSMKTSSTVEWSLILSGSTHARLGEDRVLLNAGDYVLIRPGTPNNLVDRVIHPVRAVTVKAPSDPSAKVTLPGSGLPPPVP